MRKEDADFMVLSLVAFQVILTLIILTFIVTLTILAGYFNSVGSKHGLFYVDYCQSMYKF